MFGRVSVMRQRRGHDSAEVNALQHQPAARPDGRDHALQRAVAVGDVFQDGTRVRQVEHGIFQGVGQDVVLADVQVGQAVGVMWGGHAGGRLDAEPNQIPLSA
jgi:hypothetical protein